MITFKVGKMALQISMILCLKSYEFQDFPQMLFAVTKNINKYSKKCI